VLQTVALGTSSEVDSIDDEVVAVTANKELGRDVLPSWERHQRERPLGRISQALLEVVVEVTYLTSTEDNLLRRVSCQGQREDKPATQVVRPVPHPLPRAR
jgi:hypothetical protein